MPDNPTSKPKRTRKEPTPVDNSKNLITETLIKSTIALPLMEAISKKGGEQVVHKVIIVLDYKFPKGRSKAREQVQELVKAVLTDSGKVGTQGIDNPELDFSDEYVYAHLDGTTIRELVRRDKSASPSAIYRVWSDFKIYALTSKSFRTIKSDACRITFSATGKDIVWAVIDSGIDENHPHFSKFRNLENLPGGIDHQDFTGENTPKVDKSGHGTHVAGIIAGEMPTNQDIKVYSQELDEMGNPTLGKADTPKDEIFTGMAPACKLVSLRVLVNDNDGYSSNVLQALKYVQMVNDYGRKILIHGVNISLGYPFYPTWFACGQSPLCIEVDHLVRSGVVVIVAAGNSGNTSSGQFITRSKFTEGLDISINDPGNAVRAITVGSTHRDKPYTYGVSFFSSKGPTGDGRLKPDLVAPGEKIISCAAGSRKDAAKQSTGVDCQYLEESGTSMSAPHVSGAIAAFLSVRREFIGQPEAVKNIFLSSATDLKRDRNFQGAGLVDVLRAIESV